MLDEALYILRLYAPQWACKEALHRNTVTRAFFDAGSLYGQTFGTTHAHLATDPHEKIQGIDGEGI